SISGPIDGVFRIGFVITRRPKITALLTALPRAAMVILIMGVAQTKALVLDLTAPTASKRHKRGIATYPLLATRCLHQRRRGIATKAAMFTGNGFGFHPIVWHPLSWSHAVGMTIVYHAHFPGTACAGSLYPLRAASSSRAILRRLRRPV